MRARTIKPGTAEVDVGSETISFDASWASEPSGLPGPAELLAASFSACLLKNLERAGQLLDFHYERAEVDVADPIQHPRRSLLYPRWELETTKSESVIVP